MKKLALISTWIFSLIIFGNNPTKAQSETSCVSCQKLPSTVGYEVRFTNNCNQTVEIQWYCQYDYGSWTPCHVITVKSGTTTEWYPNFGYTGHGLSGTVSYSARVAGDTNMKFPTLEDMNRNDGH
jgi:hypothetical protein